MPLRHQRPLSEDERRTASDGLSLLALRARWLAKEEARAGVAEVLELEVRRAFKLFRCAGPPCCPSWWLLDVGGGELLQACSWTQLAAQGEDFPGRQLTLELWPRTGRILRATCQGAPVRAELLDDEALWKLSGLHGRTEARLLQLHQLPEELRHALAAGQRS